MKKFRSFVPALLLVISIIVFDIILTAAIIFAQNQLFVPKDFLICTFNSPMRSLIFVIYILLDLFIYSLWKLLFKKNNENYRFKKKCRITISIITAILIYIRITSVSIFTDEKIINHSFLHPKAQVYTYKDITSVQAGIYGNRIPFVRYKGDFYYIITLKDGIKINLMDIGVEKSDDSYSQVERIDKIIMSFGAKKESSAENIKLMKLDKVYIDRFKRIIENK
jgi:hypothetical protein